MTCRTHVLTVEGSRDDREERGTRCPLSHRRCGVVCGECGVPRAHRRWSAHERSAVRRQLCVAPRQGHPSFLPSGIPSTIPSFLPSLRLSSLPLSLFSFGSSSRSPGLRGPRYASSRTFIAVARLSMVQPSHVETETLGAYWNRSNRKPFPYLAERPNRRTATCFSTTTDEHERLE